MTALINQYKIKKQQKNRQRSFTEEATEIGNKYMKRCSSAITWENKN
jgi:hypothetical protein